MNIQIFGKNKCFDTKKAERWFKERRIKYQLIDLPRYGMSRRELESVRAAVGLDALIDPKAPDADLIKYLAGDAERMERLLEYPDNIRTPVVRNGKRPPSATAPRSGRTGSKKSPPLIAPEELPQARLFCRICSNS